MRLVVGVLRGGPSHEYDVSLKSGAHVLSALDTTRYEPRDIFIDRKGVWHVHGVPRLPADALQGVDVAFNVVHGQFGEDGTLQRIFEAVQVPYTGADALTSELAFNKQQTKEAVRKLGIKVPHGAVVDANKITDLHKTALNIFRAFPPPLMVKPVVGGSSIGTHKVEHFDALSFALEEAFKISPQALVEEFIKGKEATVGVIDDFRNEKAYALMPIEIIPPKDAAFFNYNAKYNGQSTERVPGRFSDEGKKMLMRAAKMAHQGLGLAHYSRADFIVSPRGVYFLEINPAAGVGLAQESLLPKALLAVGAKPTDFVTHVIELAKKGRVRDN